MSKPVLGYWDIRGLGEPIRYMLVYKQVDFVDDRFRDYSKWINVKYTQGFNFPNLPYYIDGEHRITQSLAIMRYLARKYDLSAVDEEETVRVDVVEQQLDEFRMKFLRLCYFEFDSKKEEFLKKLPQQIKLLETFIGNKTWIAGNRLTYVDFLAYETLDWLRLFQNELYSDCPNIAAYLQRFERLPNIEQYFQSKSFRRFPIFSPWAKFGGQGWDRDES
ncbi:Glutathione S-transferase Mu 1-like protein [Dinothrombium tinctorium]|uniref:glutathione transferase n=1 Tax=Dinothrombium tinctorium TaxID=1965070 RepID=A0A3S3PGH4_9ACAR|nr:Glutathione S-transferase Mu 1-like protein [Dinothrombium tinctorium]